MVIDAFTLIGLTAAAHVVGLAFVLGRRVRPEVEATTPERTR